MHINLYSPPDGLHGLHYMLGAGFRTSGYLITPFVSVFANVILFDTFEAVMFCNVDIKIQNLMRFE